MRPLCGSYAVVVFRTVSFRQGGHQGATDRLIHWGLGSSPGGESEILGAWTTRGRGPVISSDVVLDLQERGVRCIGALVGSFAGAEGRVPPENAGPLNSFDAAFIAGHGLALREPEALKALRPAKRKAVLAVDELAEGLNRRLRVAVARHGVFADEVAAMNFVASFLMRADLQLHELPGLRAASILRHSGMSASLGTAVH